MGNGRLSAAELCIWLLSRPPKKGRFLGNLAEKSPFAWLRLLRIYSPETDYLASHLAPLRV